ncbi:ankyrin repeat domain-containing protein [Pelosinus sp. IPA-1]|uniref:ankyrin repeat domain-containing protein n=1 Tax=Pelosinus sp. IPA-1 TaxID=3029569 RepID=UPI0024361C41|nr:ankyrin repeat domain-containing protein [Pelosinus sp. IPA-1]GMA99516.1 hypothetical protein PIPA1_23160 [Pelosinus sp. IPA-1]
MANYIKLMFLIIVILLLNITSIFASSMDVLLINSVRNNDVNMVKTALSNGANINYMPDICTSPLSIAVQNKNSDMVHFLILNGANCNYQFINMSEKVTPLIQAVLNTDIKTVRVLLEAGADINGTSENGNTPIMAAATSEPKIMIVQLLISKGANVNQANNYGTTPLMIVAKHENGWLPDISPAKLAVAKLLLQAGSDTTIRDNYYNKSALDYAIDTNFKEMINLLLPLSSK